MNIADVFFNETEFVNQIISKIGLLGSSSEIQNIRMSLDPDFSPDEQEEKARLISQVNLHISTFFDEMR